MTLIDSHAHLDHPDLASELSAVLERAAAASVTRIVTIGTHAARTSRYAALADAWPGIVFTTGTHPLHAHEEPDLAVETYVNFSDHPRCVGLGEAGLDYHHATAPAALQERVFRTQIEAARARNLPLVIHARDADDDVARICEDEFRRGPFRAVLHCYSSGERLAERSIDLGFYVSLSGILTFKRSTELRRIARLLPLERLLVETDAPYLSPEPYRGKRNEPSRLPFILRILAQIWDMDPKQLARVLTENTLRVFSKPEVVWVEMEAAGVSA